LPVLKDAQKKIIDANRKSKKIGKAQTNFVG